VPPPQLAGKRTGRPKKVKEEPLSQESEGLLAAMRHVIATPPASDRTHEQKAMRDWLEEDPAAFRRHLARLEVAERASRPPLTGAEVDALAGRVADQLEAAVMRCLRRHAAEREGPGVNVAGPPPRGGGRSQERGSGQRGSFGGEKFLEDFGKP
jgi:hypothetical protein